MKRDPDLARRIMLALEENPEATGHGAVRLDIEGHSPTEIAYHVMLLDEAGLIEAEDVSDMDGLDWQAKRLTFDGHEFLDASRKDTIWQKAKAVALEKTGGVAFEVLKMAALELAKKALPGGGS